MRVRVIPYAELRRLVRAEGGEPVWLELPDGSTVGDALDLLDVRDTDHLIVGLDGVYASSETPLHNDAELILVTPMEGG